MSAGRTIRPARTEAETSNLRSQPLLHPWISQTDAWIEIRFGEDVKHPKGMLCSKNLRPQTNQITENQIAIELKHKAREPTEIFELEAKSKV
jgi:hypothetical protein